ncbi:DUF4097 family beta strand repeat-containing protein [Cellulomonas sp. PhB143]|uniref:DUF4097 family beta strand repeat-containing protein n=1 Tax=Cellulomonas sp. PhB143 TaxID=2485186 RepID=UPI000F45F717|nr:DUF4097 family beta strand repeat-containing protein [Cellulomonas sp. PhB143]ROS75344.1 putative adhesin [Cellulomonas sp. PhB143]
MTATQDQTPAAAAPPREPAGPPRRGPGARALAWLGGTVGVLLLAWGGFQLADWASATSTSATRSYAAAPVVELVADGHVTVRGGADETGVSVESTARSGFSGPTYSAEAAGDRLVVSHECGWWPSSGVCRGSLDVVVPERTEVVVHSSSGAVRASGLVGRTRLSTSDGRVEVSDVVGDTTVETSNGRVQAGDVDGNLDARSSNGAIDVSGVTGDAVLETSNGRVDVDDVAGDVDAESSNGDITVRGAGHPVVLTIETSNGERTVEGATDPSAPVRVRISTSNGDVTYLD